MKHTITFLSMMLFVLFTWQVKAQTNYVVQGDMSGVSLNYVNVTYNVNTPGSGVTGWSGYYGGSAANRAINIVSMPDVDPDSGQGDVIRITTTAANTDITNNARLVQRLVKVPIGVYTLKFKSKALTDDVTKVLVTLRTSANHVPAFTLEEYEAGTSPSCRTIYLTDAWEEYEVTFDMSKTANTLHATAEITETSTTTTFYPVICFSLQGGEGLECMIDDVSFTEKSGSGLAATDVVSDRMFLRYEGGKLLVNNVEEQVSLYNMQGQLIATGQADNGCAELFVEQPGFYVVVSGNKQKKTFLNE